MCFGIDDRNRMATSFTDRESLLGTEDHHETFVGPNESASEIIPSVRSAREVARL